MTAAQWLVAGVVGAVTATAWMTLGSTASAQEAGSARPATTQPAGGGNITQMGALLVEGLKATPGCLGVEFAGSQDGKRMIFAWFENKQSVLDWYAHPVHQGAMRQFFPESEGEHAPLEHVPDDAGPIMAIAVLTPTRPGDTAIPGMPISQISIELYTPLPGGIRLNGGFTPAEVKVPHMRDLVIDAAGAEVEKKP